MGYICIVDLDVLEGVTNLPRARLLDLRVPQT
jgi:hypothetical protein